MTDAPDDPADGLPTRPEELLARLDALGVPHRTMSHPAVHTVEELRAVADAMPGGHCKNLFLKDAKARLWLVVCLADTRVDLKRLPERIGSARLSFGNPDLLFATLGVRPGSVTPFSLVNDRERRVSVVLEKAMLDHDPVHYHPLVNTMTTAVPPAGLLRFLEHTGHRPEVVELPTLP
jgi:Ala-tRNA(Pro) deacylase